MIRVSEVLFVASFVVVLGLDRAGLAISIRPDRPVADYNALALEQEYAAAGYIADSFGSFCTATLVSPTHALTASHCIDDDADGQIDDAVVLDDTAFGFAANVPNSVGANIASAAISPDWVSTAGDPAFDVAVLTLSSPITAVTPARITDVDPSGLIGTMIGYGDQGTGTNFPSRVRGANDRLAAQNVIDSVTATIETDFDRPNGSTSTLGSSQPINLEGSTGPGDSGGPLFADFGGVTRLVGVLNGGANEAGGDDSEYGDVSEWAALRNAENLAFLAGFGILPVGVFAAGDYNGDSVVDSADYTVWRDHFGSTTELAADGDLSGQIDAADYGVWVENFSTASTQSAAVPEPATLAGVAVLLTAAWRGRD